MDGDSQDQDRDCHKAPPREAGELTNKFAEEREGDAEREQEVAWAGGVETVAEVQQPGTGFGDEAGEREIGT
jgi:hypothetical protein